MIDHILRLPRIVHALALGAAATTLALAAALIPFVQTLEWKLYDQQVRWAADPTAARRDIVVVRIDERSLRELEPFVGRWPWPRLIHAKVVEFLSRGGAKAIVYDVQLTERDRRLAFDVGGETWSGAESDRALAEAVARAGNVVLLADVTFEGLTAGNAPGNDADAGSGGAAAALPPYRLDDTVEARPVLALPYAELARSGRAIGHNMLVLDPDGPVRRHVPFVRIGSLVVPSLPVAAAMFVQGVTPERVALDGDGIRLGSQVLPVTLDVLPRFSGESTDAGASRTSRRALIDFRGPAVLPDGRTTVYREYSALDLVQASEQIAEGLPPVVDPSVFRDSLVVVGVTAAGLHDVFTTPFASGGKMTGALVHASIIDQVLSSRFIRPAGRAARWGVLLACCLVTGLAFTWLPVRWAGAIAALGAALLVGGAQWKFRQGLWLPVGGGLVGMALAATGGLAFKYFVEGREKRLVKRLFSRYLSRDVYEQLLANPALAELGGARREMTVLFCDIRGFTSLTERGAPEAVVAQLNEYFTRMVDVVFAHRGTLDKFVGDLVMALFGAPLDDAEHADHAVAAALRMVAALEDLNRTWSAEGRSTFGIGIGINSGEMIAGNIGSERIRSYTVIGDAVNLGARLESLNKEHATSIIISESTAGRLRTGYDLRPLGTVIVKGKTQPVAIFEVRGTNRERGTTDRG